MNKAKVFSSDHTAEELLLSVVVPAYNEQDVLPEFHKRLSEALNGLRLRSGVELTSEIIYVNDGSSDDTMNILSGLQKQDSRVAVLELSRNFGKEIALSAGLDHAQGDAVVIIDADLQDPPELIAQMLAEWQNGYDVVYARRLNREGESRLKKITAMLFYRIINRVGHVDMPKDTGDFRLLSRRAVDAIKQLREQHRFMKGLFAWIGYAQKAIDYDRKPRHAGKTKWNYWRLWNFALEGITSFTTAPLRLATYIGLFSALGAFIFGSYIIVRTLLYGNPIPGYPSIMVVVLFLGGVQLISIGIIGEYLGRVFNETKQRPLYLVKEFYPPSGVVRKRLN